MSGVEELEMLGKELVGRFRELKRIVAAQKAAVDARDFGELSALVTEREKVQREVDLLRARLDGMVADRPELRDARPAALVEAGTLLDQLLEADEANLRTFAAAAGEAGGELEIVREMRRMAGAYRSGIGNVSRTGRLLDETQ